mgnify:CR=1 FL=1
MLLSLFSVGNLLSFMKKLQCYKHREPRAVAVRYQILPNLIYHLDKKKSKFHFGLVLLIQISQRTRANTKFSLNAICFCIWLHFGLG